MERSMNGRALTGDGPEMQAFVAYIRFLSTGVAPGQILSGQGVGTMPELDRAPYGRHLGPAYDEEAVRLFAGRPMRGQGGVAPAVGGQGDGARHTALVPDEEDQRGQTQANQDGCRVQPGGGAATVHHPEDPGGHEGQRQHSPAMAPGAEASASPSQTVPMPIPTSGSVTVMTATAGEARSPSRKAFWLRRNPSGPRITSAQVLQCVMPVTKPPPKEAMVSLATAAVAP